MFIRQKGFVSNGRGKLFPKFYLVESVRNGAKVNQQIVAYMGDCPDLDRYIAQCDEDFKSFSRNVRLGIGDVDWCSRFATKLKVKLKTLRAVRRKHGNITKPEALPAYLKQQREQQKVLKSLKENRNDR